MAYPNLSQAKIIGLDTETYDPNLKTLGPGPRRKDGYLCGVSLATDDREWYFSLRHPESKNEDPQHFFAWLSDTVKGKEVVGANIGYDIDWLQYQCKLAPSIYRDVAITEFLLDSYRASYKLGALTQTYLGEDKVEEGMLAYAAERGWKVDKTHPIQTHIYKMPADVVRPYGAADARQALQVYAKQLPIIEAQELSSIHYIESRLIEVMALMRRNGQRIDTAKLEEARAEAHRLAAESQAIVDAQAWPDFQTGSGAQMAKLFDSLGISYPMTAPSKTTKNVAGFAPKPSFTKDFLQGLDHPIVEHLLNIKSNAKLESSFLGQNDENGDAISGIGRFLVDGRVHAIYHQAKIDFNGTEYGRFSCTMPAIQTMPGDKQPRLKKIVRSLFLPEEGQLLYAPDFSQADYRFFAHYAQGPGGPAIRGYFQNPLADMHTFTATAMDLRKPDGSLDRSSAKPANFGIMFGMGAKGLAKSTGRSEDEARRFLYQLKSAVPALRDTPKRMTEVWLQKGYVKTISGRRARLVDVRKSHLAIVMIIAGSTADIMKKSMVDAYDAGLFSTITPHQTIHDELTCSVPDSRIGAEAAEELRRTMANAYALRVPVVVSGESGSNWADVSESSYHDFLKRFP